MPGLMKFACGRGANAGRRWPCRLWLVEEMLSLRRVLSRYSGLWYIFKLDKSDRAMSLVLSSLDTRIASLNSSAALL